MITSDSRPQTLHVVAGALFDGPRVLIAQRPIGKPLAGFWEFPGGKVAAGEASYDALARELREELGIQVSCARLLIEYTHAYPERDVHLELWLVDAFVGTPQSLDAQALKWVTLNELKRVELLEADGPMVEALRKLGR